MKPYNQAPDWTEEQIAELKKLSEIMPASKIGEILGRTKNAVKNQIVRQRLNAFPTLHAIAVARKEKIVRVRTPKKKTVTLPPPPKPKTEPKVTNFDYKNPELKKEKPYRPSIDYCPECHSPVSNWQDHFERLGHRRKI